MEAKQVSARAVDELQKDIDERLEKGLKKLAEEFVNEQYKEKDKERKHELSIKMSMAFTKLAARVDAGVVIEMRAMPPDEPEAKEEGNESNEQERTSKLANYQQRKLLIDELNVRGRVMHKLVTSDHGQRLIIEKQESPEPETKDEGSGRNVKR